MVLNVLVCMRMWFGCLWANSLPLDLTVLFGPASWLAPTRLVAFICCYLISSAWPKGASGLEGSAWSSLLARIAAYFFSPDWPKRIFLCFGCCYRFELSCCAPRANSCDAIYLLPGVNLDFLTACWCPSGELDYSGSSCEG